MKIVKEYPQPESDEVCMLIPASVATGDAGEPLGQELKMLLTTMAMIGYAPLDFGLGTDESTEVWFIKSKDVSSAVDSLAAFIECHGFV